MRPFYLLFVLFAIAKPAASQSLADFDRVCGNIAVNAGFRIMGEAGIGLGYYHYDEGFLHLHGSRSILLGSQFNFEPKKPLLGPQVSVNFSGIINMGGALVYFTDFHTGSLYFNPHIGFGANTADFDVRFGYNIPLMKQALPHRVNHFTITLSYLFIGQY